MRIAHLAGKMSYGPSLTLCKLKTNKDIDKNVLILDICDMFRLYI